MLFNYEQSALTEIKSYLHVINMYLYVIVASLTSIGNYHAVTVGSVPPLVVLVHARGWLN